jgi:hypothetical protein
MQARANTRRRATFPYRNTSTDVSALASVHTARQKALASFASASSSGESDANLHAEQRC